MSERVAHFASLAHKTNRGEKEAEEETQSSASDGMSGVGRQARKSHLIKLQSNINRCERDK